MRVVPYVEFFCIFLSVTITLATAQTAGTGFSLIQEIEVGSASTGGVNDLLTGVDLDADGNGEVIVQIGQSGNGKARIYEWNGTSSYDEVWSVTLAVNNAASDQVQRLLAARDTDGDGYVELFVASSTTTSADARVYCFEMSSGALSSTNPSTTSKGPDGTGYFQGVARIRAIVTGNADGDSYGELYVGNAGNTTSIEVWEATANDAWSKVTLTGSEDDIGDGILDMAAPTDLDADGSDDDLAICEEQGALSVLDFSTLADPVKKTVNNKNDLGADVTIGRVVTYNLDNSGSPEIILSNSTDDGIFVFEWVSGSSAYDRDLTTSVLLSVGVDIYTIGASDYDNDGKGEIYYSTTDNIKYFEYASSAGDFSSSTDFASAANLVTSLSNDAYVFRPSANVGTTLLDGDQYRDLVVGTDGNATSGWGEIFVLESATASVIPSVTLTGTSGFRMMSSPVSGAILSDLLSELWTQGMTGADTESGSANVWTFTESSQSWTAVSNLSTASLTAGQGILVYVFADIDYDGDNDLSSGVTLSVTGTATSSSASVSSITNNNWALAGNPYATTIDWDLTTKSSLATSAYVWDNAASAYKSWNGSAGGLTSGLIAPYQGYWVQASGGTGSVTMETADQVTTAGTFYKATADSSGSVTFALSSGNFSDNVFVSFNTDGLPEKDNYDAWKLLPFSATERVVGMSYVENLGLDINNLHYEYEGTVSIPLDILYLTVDENNNFVTQAEDVALSWDLFNLPSHIQGLTLTDNSTGQTIDLFNQSEITLTTRIKGSFPAYGSGAVSAYPETGENHYTLNVVYSPLSSTGVTPLPKEFALHPAYPNPFNPSTVIQYDLPEESGVLLHVYDIRGTLVETLVSETRSAGTHSTVYSPGSLASGIYFVQMKAREKSFTQKITFIK